MNGSIEKRGKNSWRLVVSCGFKQGQRIKKTKNITVKVACEQKSCKNCTKATRCRARGEAEKLLAEFVLEVEQGLVINCKKMTFQAFVERWLQEYAEVNLAPKTLVDYKACLARILPAMGHLKIDQIRPIHIIEFENNLREDGVREDGKPGGLSERSIMHHHRTISAIMGTAVQWQVIRDNPCQRVKAPKIERKPAACYDEEQTAALLQALATEPLKHQVLVILALTTGMRRGELMGLDWSDVDFKSNTINVHQSSQYLPEMGTFTKDPKNETSNRVVTVPTSVMSLLKQYKREQAAQQLKVGDLWQGSDRVFTTWDGRPAHPNWPSQWFSKFIKANNLPHLNFHGLRHTAATLMIGEGINVREVSGRLGHANTSTTLNIYSHQLKSADKAAAEVMGNILERCRNKRTS